MNDKKCYAYTQMNPGGFFIDMPQVMPWEGWTRDGTLYVYAETPEEADNIAESVGVYFDGVSAGTDCDCCGDRWYRASWKLSEEDLLELHAERQQ